MLEVTVKTKPAWRMMGDDMWAVVGVNKPAAAVKP
jgi:hypothetical protein